MELGHRLPAVAAGVGGAAVAAYAWWATGLPPFSGASTAAVLAAGLAAMAAGTVWRRVSGSAPRPRPPATGVRVWAALFAALTVWEVAAYLQHPRPEHPTISFLADGLLDPHPVRAAAFLGWLAGAATLARR